MRERKENLSSNLKNYPRRIFLRTGTYATIVLSRVKEKNKIIANNDNLIIPSETITTIIKMISYNVIIVIVSLLSLL